MSYRLAYQWFVSLPDSEQRDYIESLWESNGKPEPVTRLPKKPRKKSKPPFEFEVVKALAYKSKRGIATTSDHRKFMRIFEEHGNTPEFSLACKHGQAKAVSELPFQGGFDEVLERLTRT